MSEFENTPEGAEVVPETIEQLEVVEQNEGEVIQDSTPEPDADDEKKPKKDGVQKRINELTREKWEYKRQLDEMRKAQAPVQEQYIQPPTLEQFGYDADQYQRAMIEFARYETQRTWQAENEQNRQRQEQYNEQRKYNELLENHTKREAKFAPTVPDYAEAVNYLVNSIQYPPEVGEAIGESSVSPAILYHLATHFEEAARIADLPPHKAVAEIVRLEMRLANKQKPVSKAPAPTPTLSGSSVVNKNPAEMSDEEFFRSRMR